MKFFIVILAIPFLASAAPQYGDPYGGGSSASSASSAAVVTPTPLPGQHIVIVSPDEQLVFQPNTITAAVNEIVTFILPTAGGFKHSVTQSSFAKPCSILDGGFDSGLVANAMEFTITITNASEPIWFFCQQTNPLKHCGMGMVGGINVQTSNNTIDAFVSNAIAVGTSEIVQTTTGGLTGIGALATAPAQPTTIGAASKPSSGQRPLAGVGSLLIASVIAAYLA